MSLMAWTWSRTARSTLIWISVALTMGSSRAAPERALPLIWPQIEFAMVETGLDQPVHITHANDGSERIFIVERAGFIRILRDGTVLPTPFLDISSIVREAGSEEGLLSVAFPPDYDVKGYFYVYFTDDRQGNRGNNLLARFHVTGDPDVADPLSEELILNFDHPTFSNHNGGQIAFGPDGYLYIGTGDGGGSGDPFDNAQDPGSLLGKLLRIDVEFQGPVSAPPPNGPFILYLPIILQPQTAPYGIPSDNPFVGMAGYREEIWALGLRNPWRFSFDRSNGDLYIADVGQSAREELDYQPASSGGGENYGWSCKEGTLDFNPTPVCDGLTLIDPIFEYDHSLGCSVTGGHIYRGPANSGMQGIYFMGDFCSGRIWGVQPDDSSWASSLLVNSPYSISTFGEDEAGNLYLADYASGTIYQISEAP